MSAATVSGPLAKHTEGDAGGARAACRDPGVRREAGAELAAASLILTKTGGCGPQRGGAGALPRLPARTLGVTGPAPRATCIALNDEAYAAAEGMTAASTITLEGPTKAVVKTNTWNAVGRLTGSDPTPGAGSDPSQRAHRPRRRRP